MIKTRILKFAHEFLVARPRRKEEREQRAYKQRAQVRCRELMELRYCSDCHLALEAIQLFCESCGKASGPLPAGYAVEYARGEFPDLVSTREDFDQLVG